MTTAKRTGDTTGIQWTHLPGHKGATWNPTSGCTRVSPGCDHYYAYTLHDQRYVRNDTEAQRLGYRRTSTETAAQVARRAGASVAFPPQYDLPFSQVQVLDEKRLTAPLHWRAPRAVFVDSMSDLFHEDVPDAVLDRIFAVMALTPQHIYQVLTKRPERMRTYLSAEETRARIGHAADEMFGRFMALPMWPFAHVWLGVSVEDQQRADERIPILRNTPAAVRFISAEPLLGPIDFDEIVEMTWDCSACGTTTIAKWLDDGPHGEIICPQCQSIDIFPRRLDWVIIGGESGAHARPFDLAWARSLRDQLVAGGVPVFVKQLGSRPYESEPHSDLHLRHGHGGNPEEWPVDLRVRQFPGHGW